MKKAQPDAPAKPDQPRFDGVLENLKLVVEKLEQGNLSLDESLALFENGVALAQRGHELLDAAEKRVEMLIRNKDGSEEVVPFTDRNS